jgi:hypothetical protein
MAPPNIDNRALFWLGLPASIQTTLALQERIASLLSMILATAAFTDNRKGNTAEIPAYADGRCPAAGFGPGADRFEGNRELQSAA